MGIYCTQCICPLGMVGGTGASYFSGCLPISELGDGNTIESFKLVIALNITNKRRRKLDLDLGSLKKSISHFSQKQI